MPRRPPPLPLKRPKLAQYLFDRDMDNVAAGQALGRSKEWVRLVCLPFDDGRRRIPNADDMRLIFNWTRGEIRPEHFYPPEAGGADRVAIAGAGG